MLRLKHALPLALLISVPVFSMQEQNPKMNPIQGYYYKEAKTGQLCMAGEVQYEDAEGRLMLADAPKGEAIFALDAKGQIVKDKKKGIVLAKEATATKPAMEVTWTQKDGTFVSTESTAVSTPLSQKDRLVVLLNTFKLSDHYTAEQSTLNRLQQEEDAAIKAKNAQLGQLKSLSAELCRQLVGKQVAKTGNNLNIADFEKQITQLQTLKDAEIATQKQTVSDIEKLKGQIKETTEAVIAAESANQTGIWAWFWRSKPTATPTSAVTPAAAEPAPTEQAEATESNELLSTVALSSHHTAQQSTLRKLQEEEDAATKAKVAQLDKLKASSTDLLRKLTAKQEAETGSTLKIADYEKQITKLQVLKDTEIAIQKQTVSDIEKLNATIKQTPQDVATAEAAKKAAEAANKKGWFGRGSKPTPAPVETPAAAEATANK